jgi:hypothetical protein
MPVGRLRRAGVAAIVAAGASLGGCMGDDSEEAPAAGESDIGSRVSYLDCGDWRKFDPRERSETIQAIRDFAGGPADAPGGRGATLDDDKAYKLFDSYCKQEFASHFRLYKLYTRAAAFSRRSPQPRSEP